MSREEKLLLLQLILEDIRGNWGWNLDVRVDEARDLAVELELKQHIKAIDEFKETIADGWADGRYFRMSYKQGGYEGIHKLHGLKPTILDKSGGFRSAVSILTYPEDRFDDWEEYEMLKGV